MGDRLDTWMPMYWRRYFGDTLSLSTIQHGAYMLMIGAYWLKGAPLAEADLPGLTRLQPREWKQHRARLAEFFRVDGGIWHHKRIDAEIARAEQISAKRQASGKQGGRQSASKRQASASPKPQQTAKQNPTHIHRPTEANASDGGGAPPSARRMSVYDTGAVLIADACDVTVEAGRTFVAKLCKDHGEANVTAAVEELRGRTEPVADPRSLLKAMLKGKTNGQHRASRHAEPDAADRLRAFADRGDGRSEAPDDPGFG